MTDPGEVVICGLDGVIALVEHRLHHLINDEGIKHWDRFLDACDGDMPNFLLIERLNQARAEGIPVFLITGRSEAVRRKTLAWLDQWHIGYDGLWMRPEGDPTTVDRFKAEVIARHLRGRVIRRVYESAYQVAMARWCTEHDIPCTLVGPNQGNGDGRELFDLKAVRHACDHVMLYPFYGDDDFTWEDRLRQLGHTACRLCQLEEVAGERRRQADEARLAANERGLPPLEGTDRQVEWAEGIRLRAFGAIDKVLQWVERNDARAEAEDPDHWSTVKQGIAKAVAYLEAQAEAKWWIDHRQGIMNSLEGGRALLSAVAEQLGAW